MSHRTVPTKAIEKWKEVANNCDHTKHTETINGYKACFCTKFSNVIQNRQKVTPQEFSEDIRRHTIENIPKDLIEEVANQLRGIYE